MKSKSAAETEGNATLPLPPSRARSRAWILGVLATGLVLTMILVAHHFATGLYFARLKLDLASRLAGPDRTAEIFEEPRFRELLSPTDRSARRLFDLIEALEEDRVADARQKFASDQVLREEERFKSVRVAVEKISGQEERKQALEQSIESAEGRVDAEIGRYRELRNRLRALLKLPVESEEDPLTASPFYTAGILSALPVLPGVPDEIVDERSLVSYFGGEATFPGGQLSADVKAEIPKLQAEASPIALEIARASREVGQLEAERDALDARDEDLRKAAIALARNELLSFVHPEVSSNTRLVYNAASSMLRHADVLLPPLP